nr:phosphotransferase [Nocardioidaceae bacterium]
MSDAHSTLEDALTGYLTTQRWFAGKGRDHVVTGMRTAAWLGDPDADPRVALCLVEAGPDVYQVPLSYRTERHPEMERAYLGEHDAPHGPGHVYDAVHDRQAVVQLVSALVEGRSDPPLTATVVADIDADLTGPTMVLGGEQSNTGVVVGDHLLFKVFRRVSPGRNPDIEVLSALTRAGSDTIVPFVGWLELADGADSTSGPTDLAMLSEYLRMVTDGWDLALTSVRDLFAERDLHPEEVGGDFAAESHRLGATTARLHSELARALPTGVWGPDDLAALAARMRSRLDAAVDEVPDLAAHADALAGLLDQVASSGDQQVPVQRVHGDLHLGQTLRTFHGWRIIDFEGEPERPLAER